MESLAISITNFRAPLCDVARPRGGPLSGCPNTLPDPLPTCSTQCTMKRSVPPARRQRRDRARTCTFPSGAAGCCRLASRARPARRFYKENFYEYKPPSKWILRIKTSSGDAYSGPPETDTSAPNAECPAIDRTTNPQELSPCAPFR